MDQNAERTIASSGQTFGIVALEERARQASKSAALEGRPAASDSIEIAQRTLLGRVGWLVLTIGGLVTLRRLDGLLRRRSELLSQQLHQLLATRVGA
jgi:hypothetical protein